MSTEQTSGNTATEGKSCRHANKAYEKLLKTYCKNLKLHPSFKEREALESLSQSIDPVDSICAEIDFYIERMRKLQQKQYEMYMGYHQNCGDLVVIGTRVLFCCCSEMAKCLCFGDAHVHEGRLYMCDRTSETVPGENQSTYIISSGRSVHTDHCPFCGTPVRYLERLPEQEEEKTE